MTAAGDVAHALSSDCPAIAVCKSIPALVQHQHGLIIGALDRHKAHVRARHRLTDRSRINRVVLAALDIGLDVSRRYQHHLMPHRDKFAGPMMCRAAGLHADPARLDLRIKLQHFRPLQLTRHRRTAFAGKPVKLKIILAQIDGSSDKLLHWTASLFVALRRPRFGTRCRLGGAVHNIIASVAKQSSGRQRKYGLLRRFAPRNDGRDCDLRRLTHRVVDQRLAERPDRAGDLVAGGDDVVERLFDPVAIFFA